MRNKKAAIIVFAKEPQPGKTKTRLAASLPPSCGDAAEFAASFYAACLEDLFESLKNLPWPVLLFVTPGSSPAYFCRFKVESVNFQHGADIGERMRNAFERSLEQYERLLLIGSDIPQIKAETLNQAMNFLDSEDCVLGPAEDGGYYLIGFDRAVFQDCFRGVEWSTGKVLRQTLERLQGRKIAMLETCRDIDSLEDLRSLSRDTGCPAHTRNFLLERGFQHSASMPSG